MPRSIWNGTVAFGLVRVPVKLYSATESKRIPLRESVALEFRDEDLQSFFRQVQQIALGQIGAGALEFGIFGEKPSQPLDHFRSRPDHAQLPSGRLILAWLKVCIRAP